MRLVFVLVLASACSRREPYDIDGPPFVPCELIANACDGLPDEVAPLVHADTAYRECESVANLGNEDNCSGVIESCLRECPSEVFPASVPGNIYGCWTADGGDVLCFDPPTGYRATFGAKIAGEFRIDHERRPGFVELFDFPEAGQLACARMFASSAALFVSNLHVGPDCATLDELGPLERRFAAPANEL